MKLPLIKFWQQNPKWASEKLGTSAVTIGGYGCALCALAMIEKYYNFDTDPLKLNQLLIDKSVYAERNLMKWWEINKVNEFVSLKEWIDCLTTPAPLDKIDAELEAGRPVICHVDLNPNQPGPDHFIVIIGKTEDGHYIIFDPWYDEDSVFFDWRYGDPTKGIFRILAINGPVPQPEAPQPTIADLTGQIDQWVKHFEDIKEHLRPAGIMPGDDLPKVIGTIDELVALKKEYTDYKEADKAQIEKPQTTEPSNEKFLGQVRLLNLLIKFFTEEVSKK